MAYLSIHGNLSNVVFTKSFKFIKYCVEFTQYSIESIEISRNSWFITGLNKPFYSCVLSGLAFEQEEAGSDIMLLQNFLFFKRKWSCSRAC